MVIEVSREHNCEDRLPRSAGPVLKKGKVIECPWNFRYMSEGIEMIAI